MSRKFSDSYMFSYGADTGSVVRLNVIANCVDQTYCHYDHSTRAPFHLPTPKYNARSTIWTGVFSGSTLTEWGRGEPVS